MRFLTAAVFAALLPLAAFGQPPKSDAPPPPDQQFQRGVRPAQAKSDAPLVASLSAEQKAEHAKKFPRGLKPAPEKYKAAEKFHPAVNFQTATTTQFAMVPSAIHMWGNDQYGDCVSAQTACSMAAFTTYCGQPVVPSDAEVIAFARKYNWLNGADLPEVMDRMQSTGMSVGGKLYKEGPYKAVDYKNQAAAQAALLLGPLNIAIDANALPSSAGNKMGWFATGGSPGQYGNTDHCVTLLGFGPAKYLYEQIHTPLPSGLDPNTVGFLLDTWNTIGFIDQAWVMSTVVEEYVRTPTTVGFTPPNPNPPDPPQPPTPPTPPVPPTPPGPTPGGFTGSVYYQNGVLVGFGPLPGPTPAPQDAGAAFVEKAKFCPAVLIAGLQLYFAYQSKDPQQIAAAVAALAAAWQSCNAPAPPPQGMSAAPGNYGRTPVNPAYAGISTGDCGQAQAAGACGSFGACGTAPAFAAGSCGQAGGFSLRRPLGGYFAGNVGSCGEAAAVGACGQQQSAPQYRFAPFGGRFRR